MVAHESRKKLFSKTTDQPSVTTPNLIIILRVGRKNISTSVPSGIRVKDSDSTMEVPLAGKSLYNKENISFVCLKDEEPLM